MYNNIQLLYMCIRCSQRAILNDQLCMNVIIYVRIGSTSYDDDDIASSQRLSYYMYIYLYYRSKLPAMV